MNENEPNVVGLMRGGTRGNEREDSMQTGRTLVRRLGVVLLSVTMAAALASCQRTSDGGSTEPTLSPTTPGASEPAAQSSAPSDQPSSTQVFTDMGADFRGVLADVTTEACPTTKGKVTAKGTVVNSAQEAADLFIGVIWLKPDSGDSVAMKEWTAKNVAPGESVEWSVSATLPSKPGRCVLQAKANKAGTLK